MVFTTETSDADQEAVLLNQILAAKEKKVEVNRCCTTTTATTYCPICGALRSKNRFIGRNHMWLSGASKLLDNERASFSKVISEQQSIKQDCERAVESYEQHIKLIDVALSYYDDNIDLDL